MSFHVGIIADTHGLLRPEAMAALAGVNHILHAGDVGDIEILAHLRTLAPVTAIRGNIDMTGACSLLPATDCIELAGRLFYLVHSRADLDINPEAAGIAAVISGHSHRPGAETHNGVLYLNPGSAGPRRLSLPVCVARLTLPDDRTHEIRHELLPLTLTEQQQAPASSQLRRHRNP